MVKDNGKHPFIIHLEKLAKDRGVLAALRRGLGKVPGAAPEMFPYVVPFLPYPAEPWRERAYYLIASLFALHPANQEAGNMGKHFSMLEGKGSEEALERRFVSLLSAHPEDLPVHLRQAVSFLKSKEIAINWNQLLIDLLAWGHPDRYVQRRWAGSFWRAQTAETETKSDINIQTTKI